MDYMKYLKGLRGYQVKAVQMTFRELKRGIKRTILELATGSGKTIIAAAIANIAASRGKKVTFFVDQITLVDQTIEKFTKNLHFPFGVIQGDNPLWNPDAPIQIASIQTFFRRKFMDFDVGIDDECFKGDTEIMTNRGFVRFDRLSSQDLVAQFNQHTEKIEFVKPTRLIKKEHHGEMITFKGGHREITMTPNHRFLYWQNGRYYHKEAKDVRMHQRMMGAFGGHLDGPLSMLSFKEKLLLNDLFKHYSVDEKKRKEIIALFDYEKLSGTKAKWMIEAMFSFHGREEKDAYTMDVSSKAVAEFVRDMAIFSGMLPDVTIKRGIYRVKVYKKNRKTLGKWKKTTSHFDGHVYCVEVPFGNIIVKQGNNAMITGNCHTVYKKLADLMLGRYSNVPFIGLSATPFTTGLGNIFQSLVKPVTINQLINQGHLVDAIAFGPSKPDMANCPTRGGDYAVGEGSKRARKKWLVGSIVDTWLEKAQGKQTLCFAFDIEHSKYIVEEFRMAGIDARHVDAYTKSDESKRVIEQFRRGEFPILSSVSKLTKGFDAPIAEVGILARSTKSLALHMQMIGRILRPYPGKEQALILDHAGNIDRLGFHTEPTPDVLDTCERGSKKKNKAEKPLPKPCPKCKKYNTVRASVCSNCGCIITPQVKVFEKNARLVEIKKKKKSGNYQQKQDYYSELLWIAAEQNYKFGWVAHMYRDRFGVWPRKMKQVIKKPSIDTLERAGTKKLLNVFKRKSGKVTRVAK